jgi:uncharacterized protein YbjT (DUF2867 family)
VRIVVTGATGFAGGATLTPPARRRPDRDRDRPEQEVRPREPAHLIKSFDTALASAKLP